MRSRDVLLVAMVIALSACAAASPSDARETEAAIVNGKASSEDAVVGLYSVLAGGLCTGTLIAPRVVLTAKHCVQRAGEDAPDDAAYFSVGLGPNIFDPVSTYRAVDIRTTPGSYTTGGFGLSGALVGVDVAVMILETPVAGVTPVSVRRDMPTDQLGKTVRAVGYGNTPSGGTGRKLETTATVTKVDPQVLYTGTATCQGDSGGPLFQADGQLIAVTSFGTALCGSGFAGFNLVSPHLALIDDAVNDSGACLMSGAEVCDGFDNDCNDEVDEGCQALGEPCTSGDECVGGRCLERDGAKFCSSPCDPLQPTAACGPGLYCARTEGCEGACVPLPAERGMLGNDANCERDADCASLFCADPGDGQLRCLTPCRGDAGGCYAEEVCVAAPGDCGGCFPGEFVIGKRGLGEPCGEDAACRSGACLAVADAPGTCTRACDADTDCGAAFHCGEGTCLPGVRGGVGALCSGMDDCQEDTVCAATEAVSWCTVSCEAEADCPDGFGCVASGATSVCAPAAGLLGEACAAAEDCVTGVCAGTTAGRRCTRSCGPLLPCDTGLECERTSDGLDAYCVAPGVDLRAETGGGGGGGGRGGGCALVGGGAGFAPPVAALLGVFSAVLWRRRRR